MGLKNKLKAAGERSKAEKDRKKQDPKARLYNRAGSQDALGRFLADRLRNLNMTQVAFAERTAEVRAQSNVSSRTAQVTRSGLVSRCIAGTKSIPLPRLLTWAPVLEIDSDTAVREFVDIVIKANALRDVRRLMHDQNPTKEQLELLLDESLSAAVRQFESRHSVRLPRMGMRGQVGNCTVIDR